jgi:hypothetical protein
VEAFGDKPWGEFTWGGKSDPNELEGLTFWVYHVADQAYRPRFEQVDLIDESNADGYLEAGRWITGRPLIPEVNCDFGWGVGVDQEIDVEETEGGQEWFYIGAKHRVESLKFSWLTEAEAHRDMLALDLKKGMHGDYLIIPRPDSEHASRLNLYCRLTALGEHRQLPRTHTYERAYRVRELL